MTSIDSELQGLSSVLPATALRHYLESVSPHRNVLQHLRTGTCIQTDRVVILLFNLSYSVVQTGVAPVYNWPEACKHHQNSVPIQGRTCI